MNCQRAAPIALLLWLGCSSPSPRAFAAGLPELQSPRFRFVPAQGLGSEKGVCRRDPSDVIEVGSTYFVWYTKVLDGPGVYRYPSGYSGHIWYATSEDGLRWKERGETLGKGPPGAFDEHGVFTPGILAVEGKYYLFYTAVPKPMSDSTPTAIGIAVAESPRGPWRRFPGNPVLQPAADPALFDSFRVDDSSLIIRDGKYWLYYKGRQAGHRPSETKWGLAIAARPTGPYLRYSPRSVVDSGHEVLVWPHREGVAALVGPTGPDKNTIQYAPDRAHFRVVSRFVNPPRAPGGYRLDAFTNAAFGRGMEWGLSMIGGRDPYLVRFECGFLVPRR